MLPLLALMIGAYIVLRSWSFIMRSGDRGEHWTVVVLAFLVMLVSIAAVIGIFVIGAQVESETRGIRDLMRDTP
jgi:hypothetical protein